MRFSCSESKRQSNITDHGLDFVDAPRVFDGVTYTSKMTALRMRKSAS